MPFNSYLFIFIFLPITIVVFFVIGHSGRYQWAIAWLVGASLFFYGWWNPLFLFVIVGSILFNYYWGMVVGRGSKKLLAIGVAANLSLLGYFKPVFGKRGILQGGSLSLHECHRESVSQ